MNANPGVRMAGFLFGTPLGEELLEGTIGGTMAGLSQLGSDQPLEQTALETAAAIAAGIGMGMVGRRLGARVGRAIHEKPLKNQEGGLAMFGRLLGSETTAQGATAQYGLMKNAIKEELVNRTTTSMAQEAASDPVEFLKRYGVTADEFQEAMPGLKGARMAGQFVDQLMSMPKNQREAFLNSPEFAKFTNIERVVTTKAAEAMDDQLREVLREVQERKAKGDGWSDRIPGSDLSIEELTKAVLNPVESITGEHVGKGLGRFLGDEAGVILGMYLGSKAAEGLGIENPKDKKIRELEQALQGGR